MLTLKKKKMKKLLLILSVFTFLNAYSQTNPNLSVGLESLTAARGTIDVEALTQIIVQKQKELKGEVLKRFMLKLFPESNYTTKFYIQNCLNVLINEKNPKVIEKEILELTTNYALSLGVTYALIKSKNAAFIALNDVYNKYADNSGFLLDQKIEESKTIYSKHRRILRNEYHIIESKKELDSLKSKSKGKNYYKKIKEKKDDIDSYKKIISKLKLKYQINDSINSIYNSRRELYTHILTEINNTKTGALKDSLCSIKKNIERLEIDSLSEKKETILKKETKTLINNFLKSLNEEEKDSKKTNYIFISDIKDQSNKYKKSIDSTINGIKIITVNNSKKTYVESLNRIVAIKNNIIFLEKITLNNTLSSVTTESLNKYISNIIHKELEIDTPFGVLLDAVSYSLSNMELLQEKGFFKNKIDFTQGNYFLRLGQSNEGKKFRETIMKVTHKIEDDITPYIKHYDIINEFLKNNKDKNLEEITDEIIKEIKNQSAIYVNESILKLFTKIENPKINGIANKIKTFLTEKNTIENYVNLSILSPDDKKTYDNQIDDTGLFTITKFNTIKTNLDIFKNEINESNYKSVKNEIDKFKLSYNDNSSFISILDTLKFKHLKTNLNILIEKNVDGDIKTKLETIKNDSEIFKKITTEIKETHKIQENEKANLNKLDTIIKNYYTSFSAIKRTSIDKQQDHISKNFKILIDLAKDNIDSYIKTTISEMAHKVLAVSKITHTDTVNRNHLIKVLPKMFADIKNLYKKKESITIKEINLFEEKLSIDLIKLNLYFGENTEISNLISHTNFLIPLLKIKLLSKVKIGKYNDELLTLFKFISNLNNLDKAETFTSIVDMLRTGSEKVKGDLPSGQFKNGYLIFLNAMRKYTIVNTSDNYINIDVVSFLSDLQNYFDKNDDSKFSLYLTLGLSENVFFEENFHIPGTTDSIKNIGFASEKIGLRFKFLDFKRYRGYENVIQDDIYLNNKAPFINDFYGIIYGSGLLYSLANTSTNKNFNFPHVGIGAGLRFYNSLDFNVTLGLPFVKDSQFLDHSFISIGFDIPLGEYLEKIGN
jgi:hypothetical protein